jgi:hypothetical protein
VRHKDDSLQSTSPRCPVCSVSTSKDEAVRIAGVGRQRLSTADPFAAERRGWSGDDGHFEVQSAPFDTATATFAAFTTSAAYFLACVLFSWRNVLFCRRRVVQLVQNDVATSEDSDDHIGRFRSTATTTTTDVLLSSRVVSTFIFSFIVIFAAMFTDKKKIT